VSCGEGIYNMWGRELEVFEVVQGRERENGHERRFSPPNANTERNVLNISRGLV
jgi:hypothetical protein